MAGASSWSGSIRFGLAQFPIKAKAAVKAVDFAFNMHHADPNCLGRLAQNGYVCTACGEVVPKDEVVKGFDGVAPVDTEYLESLRFEKNPVLEVDALVPADQIDPRYYQKSYDVAADKGGGKMYVVFLKLLQKTKRVAIGKVVMGGKEFIVTIRPRDGVLAMEVMYWPDELKSNADAKASIADAEVSKKELDMALQLAEFISKDFEPEAYKNVLAQQVGDYLEAFKAGRQPTPIVQKSEPKAAGGSLEEILAQSVAALSAAKAKPKRQRKVA